MPEKKITTQDTSTAAPEPVILNEKVIAKKNPNVTPTQKEDAPKPRQSKRPSQKDSLTTKSAMLHTYKQDVEGLVRRRKVSMVSAMAAQSDAKNASIKGGRVVNTLKEADKKTNTATFMVAAGIALFVLAAIAIFMTYAAYQSQQNNTVADRAQVLAIDSILFTEHRVEFDMTERLPRESLSELTRLKNGLNATLGSITQILPTVQAWDANLQLTRQFTMEPADLLHAFGLSLSTQFYSQLGFDYMFGMHVSDFNAPFLLLTVTSYDHAFAEMLAWEGVAEVQLSPLFSTITESTSGKRTIEDIVIQNMDARVVRDDLRNLKLLYSFLDKNTLLITNNIHTLLEVDKRYTVRKASR